MVEPRRLVRLLQMPTRPQQPPQHLRRLINDVSTPTSIELKTYSQHPLWWEPLLTVEDSRQQQAEQECPGARQGGTSFRWLLLTPHRRRPGLPLG